LRREGAEPDHRRPCERNYLRRCGLVALERTIVESSRQLNADATGTISGPKVKPIAPEFYKWFTPFEKYLFHKLNNLRSALTGNGATVCDDLLSSERHSAPANVSLTGAFMTAEQQHGQ
jgi:hypothetical protein